MDSDRGPGSELCLRHVEHPAERREDKEGDGVEDEYYAEGDGHFVVIGFQHGADRCDGASSADGCARRDQVGGLALEVHPVAEKNAENHYSDYGNDGEHHAVGTAFEGLGDVHSESKADNRCLQQIFRRFFIEFGEGHREYEGENQPGEQGDRGRDKIAGSDDHKGENNQQGGKDVDPFAVLLLPRGCDFFFHSC